MPKILSFGEIIWDVYENEQHIGGAPLNFAAHAKRCGAKSFMISAVGNDELGKDAIEIVKKLQIDERFIKANTFATGKCEVLLDKCGIPTYNVLENTAFDNIVLSDEDIEEIKNQQFDALYFGTLIQRNSVSKNALEKLCKSCNFREIICDINLRKNCYDRTSTEFCLKNASILKISDEEEPLLRELGLYYLAEVSYESIAKAITAEFPNIKILIITLGEKGSFIYESQKQSGFLFSGEKAQVVSTVGAGDSYTAAWCVSYLIGESILTATEKATKLSAYVVSHKDAIPTSDF
ncbi:MAG: carbohydrate kinase [Ruminococcaceae bacterium]|nr:carbohydrate kinase [Oscillospiraceae bacterium]